MNVSKEYLHQLWLRNDSSLKVDPDRCDARGNLFAVKLGAEGGFVERNNVINLVILYQVISRYITLPVPGLTTRLYETKVG